MNAGHRVVLAGIIGFALPASPLRAVPAGLSADVLAEIKTPDRLPGTRYQLVRQWETENPPCGHGPGRAVKDPSASGGAAWEARPGRDANRACIVFGPYFEAAAGDYAAFFRLKLLESGEGPVAVDAIALWRIEAL